MNLPTFSSLAFGAGALGLAGAAAYLIVLQGAAPGVAAPPPEQRPASPGQGPGLVVRLTAAERQALGIETTPAQSSSRPEQVRMAATTALNPDALAHVHARFAGEVTAVKADLGQRVRKGQLLAEVWSKDLGEKKSEYVDARSQLRLNEDVLHGLEQPYRQGAIPERTYRQAVRDVESARIAMNRAYRTLISWRLTPEEIENISKEKDANWPRESVLAPIGGVVVEKNVIPGELIDTTVNLFVIADLSRLSVWAYAFEEDLPRLHAGQDWTVTLQALPAKALPGKVSVVGAVVDPTQHTATVQGTIANPDEKLRAGMFATAVVPLRPAPGQVAVPTAALIDAGDRTFVYVESPGKPDEFTRRPVRVQERLPDETYLTEGVSPGEIVVNRGALELDRKGRSESE